MTKNLLHVLHGRRDVEGSLEIMDVSQGRGGCGPGWDGHMGGGCGPGWDGCRSGAGRLAGASCVTVPGPLHGCIPPPGLRCVYTWWRQALMRPKPHGLQSREKEFAGGSTGMSMLDNRAVTSTGRSACRHTRVWSAAEA